MAKKRYIIDANSPEEFLRLAEKMAKQAMLNDMPIRKFEDIPREERDRILERLYNLALEHWQFHAGGGVDGDHAHWYFEECMLMLNADIWKWWNQV